MRHMTRSPASCSHRPENRRTRLEASLSPQLRDWLTRTTRVHSGLCSLLSLLGRPSEAERRAGGETAGCCDYAERVRNGEPSLLFDALQLVSDQLAELIGEVQAVMDEVEPCPHPPGSLGKITAMTARVDQGRSLFIEADCLASLI